MLVSDRQADSAVARWIDLMRAMHVNGFEVGHALKRPFFLDWLARSKDTQGRISGFRNWAKRLLAANAAAEGPKESTVLILRAGRSERELLNFQGLRACLADLGVAEVRSSRHSPRQPSAIYRALTLQLLHRGVVAAASRRLRRHAPVLRALRREFDLPEWFDRWFRLELDRALWCYFGAKAVLQRARPRVVVSAGDNLPVGYCFHVAARELGIPSVALQHGFIGQEWLHHPVWADKVCVWGEVERSWYLGKNAPAERIKVTGNPRGLTSLPVEQRSQIRERLGCASEQRLVVWFTTPHGGGWTDRLLTWLRDPAMQGLEGTIVLKVHPNETASSYHGRVPANVKVAPASELDLGSAFAAADVVVHDHSSVGAEAHFCGQNVICAGVNPPYPSYYSTLRGPQQFVETPIEMVGAIRRLGAPQLVTRESPCLRLGGERASQAIADEIRDLA